MIYFVEGASDIPGVWLASKDPDKFQDFDVTLPEINIDDFDVNLDDWGISVDEPTEMETDNEPQIKPTSTYYPLSRFQPITRAHIRQALACYCSRYRVGLLQAGTYFHQRLATVFGVEVDRLERFPKETTLSALERVGFLEKLYVLIRAELAYSE